MAQDRVWTNAELLEMWPQAAGELRAFKRYLEARAGITAAQLSMAIQLAEAEFKRLSAEETTHDPTKEPSASVRPPKRDRNKR